MKPSLEYRPEWVLASDETKVLTLGFNGKQIIFHFLLLRESSSRMRKRRVG